ncbi:hypothetical protein CISG_05778 [Coccidioides immitis RMSCC 3703]|uniref:Uncharacterized protein n=1 Tax=Coccidioides immitis RMSCC 3703 TaxID=454286 RepID=A0A0J8QX93_COCIT|nr:hypothetical protein CISG_05778 [Coccidioides immitis RMSCC 3703]
MTTACLLEDRYLNMCNCNGKSPNITGRRDEDIRAKMICNIKSSGKAPARGAHSWLQYAA